MTSTTELREARHKLIVDARAILDKADEEKREVSAEEREGYDKIMTQAAEKKASDLHIHSSAPLRVRVHGELLTVPTEGLDLLLGLDDRAGLVYKVHRGCEVLPDGFRVIRGDDNSASHSFVALPEPGVHQLKPGFHQLNRRLRLLGGLRFGCRGRGVTAAARADGKSQSTQEQGSPNRRTISHLISRHGHR